MKKKITALLLALTLLLSATALTGCGGGSGESSDGPVSLTLSLWDEAQLPVIQENVDAFNAAHEGEIKSTSSRSPGTPTGPSWMPLWRPMRPRMCSG